MKNVTLHINRIEWSSEDINDEQKHAVTNILKQTSYPFPYVLFGPPGTGKTRTIIEAILQIIRGSNAIESPENILVCATSNSACNEITKRLIDRGISNKILRIFSKSVQYDTSGIPENVLAVSNLSKGEHYFPSLKIVYKHQVSLFYWRFMRNQDK